jgi:hypothetical protein
METVHLRERLLTDGSYWSRVIHETLWSTTVHIDNTRMLPADTVTNHYQYVTDDICNLYNT